mgnify:CR=1 FL=1
MSSDAFRAPIDPDDPANDLSVGIHEIDDEHREFFVDLRRLDAALAGGDVAEVRRLLGLIVDNAQRHFAQEEVLFGRLNYPDVEQHAAQHRALSARLARLIARIDAGGLAFDLPVAGRRLTELLRDHVLKHDMKYRDFIQRYRLVPF